VKPFLVSFESWCRSVDPVLLVVAICGIVLALTLEAARRRRASRSAEVPVQSQVQATVHAPEAVSTAENVESAQISSDVGALADNAPAPVVSAALPLASITSGMKQTRSSFFGRLKSFFSARARIDTSHLDDLEELLIASDVGPRCANDLVESVRKAVQLDQEVTEAVLTELLKRGIREQLVDVPASHRIYSGDGAPLIVLVVGVNGAGKTTTVAKLAARYKADGKKVLVVAADTFRAAAVHQLEEWSKRIGFEVVKGAENAKPAAVVFDGMLAAKGGGYDVVLVDTAGRLHTKTNLMQELEGVRNSITRHIPDGPHETILVVDGVSGQNALMQARQFNEAVSLTGVVVTKLDGTPKGGIIVPICQELKVPIVYVGVGEKASDLIPFSADEFIAGMFDQTEDAEMTTSGTAVGGIRL
jgi:fused signal recognition particle receptor